MTNKSAEGCCHICGNFTKLSYEHIPPKSAYNNSPVFVAHGRQLFDGLNIDQLKKKKQQQGAGGYTLCVKCNNDTGGWYGRAYVDWVVQVVTILERAKEPPTLYYPFRIYPLRVIKQIITMFFSVNSPEFREKHSYLEKFVLNKDVKYIPPDIDVYVGYTIGEQSRSAGVTGLLNGAGLSPEEYIFSEIAFPPFVFIMTFNSKCPDSRLINISEFASYCYDYERTFDLRLPVLSVKSTYPADYRTEFELVKATE